MRRTSLRSYSEKRKAALQDRGASTFSTLERTSSLARGASKLARTPLKAKRRKPKPGDDPAYKAWIRSLPCVVGGSKKKNCKGRLDPHHMTGGKGDQRRGKGQTVSDRNALPLCRMHHDDIHDGTGFCKGWSKDRRRVFQEHEIARLNKIWDEHEALGVWQEPMAEAI